MPIDFALKDFYRKRNQTFPYVMTITLIIAFTEFLINFTTSIGLNLFIQNTLSQEMFENEFYFSGSINIIYSQFNFVILILIMLLTFIVVVVITTSLIISKKRDIAIMKALGTLPNKLYGFYLLEAFIIFIIGFVLGVILGLIAFIIFAYIMSSLNFTILFQIDLFFTEILFISCLTGIFLITGFKLRKIGDQKIVKTLSRDIPHNYDASRELEFIPKWLASLGINIKMAVVNTIRRRGEFIRYFLIFSFVFLIIFTLGLGTLVLNYSSQEWIRKSQGEDIVIVGHEDTIKYYTQMYQMFSDPSIYVDKNDINFIDSKYLFNFSSVEDLNDINEIEKIDQRLIKFCPVEELDGYHYYGEGDSSGYETIGQGRTGNFPIIGINPNKIVQDFEIEGRFFTKEDDFDNMTIGDGLAYNFFDYAFDQSLKLEDLGHRFHISGVVVDSFYSGYAGYISLEIFQEDLNFTQNEINLILLKLEAGTYDDIKKDLDEIIEDNLGEDFTHFSLDKVFEDNLNYLSVLSLYPLFLIIAMSLVAILSLYNYQKAGLMDKAKDFLIMRAIGSKNKSLRRILFLEAFFVILPSLLLSLGIGMIINSLVLFDRVYLPPLYIPFLVMSLLFITVLIFNILSLIPIMKKINKFSIKDFEIY